MPFPSARRASPAARASATEAGPNDNAINDQLRMDAASGYCEGCLRSLEEIASWSEYSAAEKRAVLALLPARKQSP